MLRFERPIKYEILLTALVRSAVMFRLVCEFMKTIEEIHPLPTHPSYFDEWYTDIYDFWITTGEECPKELYTVLALRKRIYDASFDVEVKTPSTDAFPVTFKEDADTNDDAETDAPVNVEVGPAFAN